MALRVSATLRPIPINDFPARRTTENRDSLSQIDSGRLRKPTVSIGASARTYRKTAFAQASSRNARKTRIWAILGMFAREQNLGLAKCLAIAPDDVVSGLEKKLVSLCLRQKLELHAFLPEPQAEFVIFLRRHTLVE